MMLVGVSHVSAALWLRGRWAGHVLKNRVQDDVLLGKCVLEMHNYALFPVYWVLSSADPLIVWPDFRKAVWMSGLGL